MSESGIETVRRIAALARLDVGAEEGRALAEQFERILGHFEALARLDVAGIEQTAVALRQSDQRRADEPREGFSAEAALRNAPARVEDFYSVPKTVGGEE